MKQPGDPLEHIQYKSSIDNYSISTTISTPPMPNPASLISVLTGHIATLQRELDEITPRKKASSE